MEYPGDAFHTFMDLDSAIYLAVNGTVTSLPVFIQNILNCVLKTNEALRVYSSDNAENIIRKNEICFPLKKKKKRFLDHF